MTSEKLTQLLNNPDVPNEIIQDFLLDEGINVAKVFVVYGQTGEYSDRSDWNVAAFLDEQSAKDLLNKIIEWCKKEGTEMDATRYGKGHYYNREWAYGDDVECKNPYDPNMHVDYTGVYYGILEIPLKG